VLFDAAAAINWATPASTVISAGQHVHWSTQSDMHMAAGATLSSVAGASASLFTHAGGVQVIAANGPVSVQAHTDALEIVADKEVVAVSVNGAIGIEAKTKIVLQAGHSSITLEGGDITFACPGNFTAKGGKHLLDKGASKTATPGKLPTPLAVLPSQAEAPATPVFDEQIVYKDSHGVALAQMHYHAVNTANTLQGLADVSPADGALERLGTPATEPIDYILRYANFKHD
jgi:uncharacterized protein (DUF2345 family)